MHAERPTFARPCGGRLQLGQDAWARMRSYVQDESRKREAGGVLLGRHIRDTRDIVIDAITVPMRGDRRARCSFERAAPRHQDAIDHAWAESGGTSTYLGEWHTHPEPAPAASSVDAGTWSRKLLVDRYTGCLFFVIVGTREVRVWEGQLGREPFVLAPVPEGEPHNGRTD